MHQTVDDNGKAVDIIKEYGCGHESNKRYYPKYGRIEDEEVIQRHRKWEEDMRKKNAIVEPPPPSSTDI